MKHFLLLLLLSTSLLASPPTVVFDFGGVLTAEPQREVVITFLRESLHLTETDLEKARLERKTALEKGQTEIEFWNAYAFKKGIQLQTDWLERLKGVFKQAINVRHDMYALVGSLKEKKIQVAMLSNIDERLAKLLRELGLYEPFEPCLLSCDLGISKPDQKIYEILLEKLHRSAKDVIFIDDKIENVEGAKALGIDALLFLSPEQIKEELKTRGIL